MSAVVDTTDSLFAFDSCVRELRIARALLRGLGELLALFLAIYVCRGRDADRLRRRRRYLVPTGTDDADRDTVSDADAGRERDALCDPNADGNRDSESERHSIAESDAVADSQPHAESDAFADAEPHADANAFADAEPHADANTGPDRRVTDKPIV